VPLPPPPPILSFPGHQRVPVHFKTCPVVAPEGASLAIVTAVSAIFVVVTALLAIVRLPDTVPVTSPIAV
jgi:hypothetical protein